MPQLPRLRQEQFLVDELPDTVNSSVVEAALELSLGAEAEDRGA